MRRPLALFLALLLALSPPVAAVSVSGASPSAASVSPQPRAPSVAPSLQSAPDNNSTAMLLLARNETVRSAYLVPGLSLGTALEARHAALESEFDVALLKERLSHVETADRKREAVFQFTYRIENRIERLHRQDGAARRAFVNGSISADVYAQRLARIDAKADRMRTVLDRVRSISRSRSGVSIESRYWSLRFKLGALSGPVREKIGAMAAGDAPPNRIYVASTRSSVVLGTIDDGVFVREITRLDNYATEGESRVSFEGAQRHVSERYPRISDIGNSGGSSSRGTNVGISRFTYTNVGEYGEVTIYFDGRSGKVYKEIRRQRVSLLRTRTANATADDVTLAVNHTYATGPMTVDLRDADSGTSVNGTILVNGREIADTGADGRLRLVAPTDRFTVTAVRGNETVTVSIRPSRTPPAEP